MFDIAHAFTKELTIRVSKHQLCIYDGAGSMIYEDNNKCLFEFNQMFLALNRVIHNRMGSASMGRVGSGLCEVCGYWSSSTVSQMC